MDSRHTARIKIVQELYSAFYPNELSKNKLSEKAKDVLAHTKEIDQLIGVAAPKFPVDKIAFVDLAILRLAIFELHFDQQQPPKVVMNEAVELAKEMGGDRSPAFVNAVLGKIYTDDTNSV